MNHFQLHEDAELNAELAYIIQELGYAIFRLKNIYSVLL